MKRRAAKLFLFLLLGAVLNVAVAWGFVWLVNLEGDPSTVRIAASNFRSFHDEAPVFVLRRYELRGACRLKTFWPTVLTGTVKPSDKPQPTMEEVFGDWLPYATSPDNFNKTITIDIRGWPMLSTFVLVRHNRIGWDDVRAITLYDDDYMGGFAGPDWPTDPMYASYTNLRVFPVAPIWPGFAINTVFYAAISGCSSQRRSR